MLETQRQILISQHSNQQVGTYTLKCVCFYSTAQLFMCPAKGTCDLLLKPIITYSVLCKLFGIIIVHLGLCFRPPTRIYVFTLLLGESDLPRCPGKQHFKAVRINQGQTDTHSGSVPVLHVQRQRIAASS